MSTYDNPIHSKTILTDIKDRSWIGMVLDEEHVLYAHSNLKCCNIMETCKTNNNMCVARVQLILCAHSLYELFIYQSIHWKKN